MADFDTDTNIDQGTSGDTSEGGPGDFEKVAPLNPSEDPAHVNFLPDPAERETPAEGKQGQSP